MPTAAPRPCAHPGCPALVARGYCPAHERTAPQAVARREKVVDPFYKSVRWQRLRSIVLRRSPFCLLCHAPATVVDHIHERQDGGEAYDESNLRSLCASCHAKLPGHGFNTKEKPCAA